MIIIHTNNKEYGGFLRPVEAVANQYRTVKKKGNKEKKFKKCKYCEALVPNIRKHIKSEHPDILFYCSQCGAYFFTADSLEQHSTMKHADNSNFEQKKNKTNKTKLEKKREYLIGFILKLKDTDILDLDELRCCYFNHLRYISHSIGRINKNDFIDKSDLEFALNEIKCKHNRVFSLKNVDGKRFLSED